MDTNKISTPSISLPQGGGAIKGIGETFQGGGFSGTGKLSLPISVSPSRDAEPSLSLSYDSGSGNGIFGLGFTLSLPGIARRTDNGVPKYNDTDTFVLTGDEDLVVKLIQTTEGWLPDTRYETVDGVEWKVTSYMPRVEGSFSSIEQWRSEVSAEDVYWKVVTAQNATTYYGTSSDARIADPENATRIFSWLPEQTIDSHGNKTLYKYKRENGANVPPSIYEQGRMLGANRYIESIRYGNYIDSNGAEQFAFDVVFDYGGYDLQHPDNPPTEWPVRTDPFSSYRAGFEVRTLRLCRGILQYQQFENELSGKRFLVRVMELKYDETPVFSFLKSAQPVGYRLNSDGTTYERKALPPVEFSYSPYHPADQEFLPLVVEGGLGMPGNPSTSLQFVDLYGEGIAGFLQSNTATTLYWEPQGGGVYSAPETPEQFPIEKNLNNPVYSLIDLDGNGRLDLMVGSPLRAGFYGNNDTGAWLPFRNFESYPPTGFGPGATMADLTGGGRSDIVELQRGRVTMYPSKSILGFGLPLISVLESDFPLASSAGELVVFGDLFGDGMTHRIRICNGEVVCWPGLGYGHFGTPVRMANAPYFGEDWDPSRLILADTDGSGAADILYVHPDRVDVYLNCSGNSFAEPISIPLPEPYSSIDSVQVAAITGSGSACFLFSKMDGEVRHYYYNFAGQRKGSVSLFDNEVKPYLITEMNNNIGSSTRIRYVSSTKFYLADKHAGKPWATRMPFPVQVVDTVESIDFVSGSKSISRYAYHDGYYDPVEREFRGFGYVEQWESLTFGQYIASELHSNAVFRTGSADLHEPPVYTRTWYHTGAYMESGVLSRQYASEYYKGDPLEYSMPDSVLDPDIYAGGGQTIREAFAALKGNELRTEVYGLDGSAAEENPYRVSESNYKVRMLQPRYGVQAAVFLVEARESIVYDYERNPTDPRAQHTFTLDTDAFGNVLLSAQVFYGRRIHPVPTGGNPVFDIYPEQTRLLVIASTAVYINVEVPFRVIGLPCEQANSELSGMSTGENMYFSFDQISGQVGTALLHSIPYGTEFSPGELQSRPFSRLRSYFWNEEQTDALPLGSVSSRALPHHGTTAVFTPSLVTSVYGELVSESLIEENGYIFDDGYWWNPGSVSVFLKGADNFFQLETVQDPFGGWTKVEYDVYRLNPIRTTQLVEITPGGEITNVVNARIDYQVLQPWEVVNINNVVNQLVFDPLGFVVAMTIFGDVDGQRQGDSPISDYELRSLATLDDVLLVRPHYYLQQATGYYYYDLNAWRDRGEPVCSATLLRETYVSDLPDGAETRIRKTVEYTDGFGRQLEQVSNAAPCEQGGPDEIWMVSGKTVYNNKSNPVEQYFSYYTAQPYFNSQDVLCGAMPIPTITQYDALSRPVRVDTPKGFFTATVYQAWTQLQYDEDDTVKDSIYYKNHIHDIHPDFRDELNALEKAAVFFDTPTGLALDSGGREFLWVNINVQQDVTGATSDIQGPFYLSTRAALNIQGEVLAMTDPRLGALVPPVPNVTQIYDMAAQQMSIHSVDAGNRLLLYNVFGKETVRWDSRNLQTTTTYDLLQRIVKVHVVGTDVQNGLVLDQVVERVVYGDTVGGTGTNLRGEVYQYYDGAGTLLYPLYNIQRQPLQSIRQFCRNYRTEVNWDNPADVPMLDEQFTTSTAFDALGNQTSETTPSAGTMRFGYTINGWPTTLDVEHPDGSTEAIVSSATYQPDGQARNLTRGNGATSTYTYEPTTLRLLKIYSERPVAPADSLLSNVLQDISYTYDPVGNITRSRDYTQRTVFCDQQEVEPLSDYTYDAIYRLILATGRQHPGIQATTFMTGFKQTLYMPLCQQPHTNDMEKLENYRELYTYDDSNNLTKLAHYAASQSWTRIVNIPTDSNRAVPAASPQTTYDGCGNMLALDNLPSMRWDWRNMLASAAVIVRDQPGNDDADYYNYDYAGQRARKDVDRLAFGGDITDTKETLYLGRQIIYRTYRTSDGGEVLVDERISLHASNDNTRFAIIDTTTVVNRLAPTAQQEGLRQTRYQLNNNLSSSVVEVDASANVISYEEYFPFGGTSVIAGNSMVEVAPKVYRYCGKEADDSTGLYYYGARYYISWLGRWASPDPAGPVDGLNFYEFVNNNPTSSADIGGFGRVRLVSWNIRGTNENNRKLRRSKARRLAGLFNNHGVDIIVLQEAGSTVRKFKRSLRHKLNGGLNVEFIHSGSKPPSGRIGTTNFSAEGRQDHYLVIYNKARVKDVTLQGFPNYPTDTNIVNRYNNVGFRNRTDFAARLGYRRPLELRLRLRKNAPGVTANTNAQRNLTLYTWHAPEGGGNKRDAIPGIELFNASTHLTTQTGGNTPLVLAGDLNATGGNVNATLSNFQGISRVTQGNWDHIVGSDVTNTPNPGLNGRLGQITTRNLSDHPPVGSDVTW